MDKVIAFIICAALLCGCPKADDIRPPPVTVTKNVYLIPEFKDDTMTLPPNIKPLDLEKATQKDVSKWIIENENRTVELEKQILKFKNAANVIKKKENLKDGDYRVIELGKEDLEQ